MRFPHIEKLKLNIKSVIDGISCAGIPNYSIYVKAEDLEAALEKATVVYSNAKNIFWAAQTGPDKGDTYKALLINVEEIPNEPLKHEIESFYHDDMYSFSVAVPKSFEGKKFKTIFEEIKE